LDSETALVRATRENAVFQRRVDGWSTAVILALDSQRSEVLGNTLQLHGEGLPSKGKPWQYLGSLSPSIISAELVEQFIRLRDLLARQFGLRGLVGVDAIVDTHNRLWIMEVNPRYTASVEVVERMTGRSSIEAHLAACGFANWESFGSPIRLDVNVPARRSFGKAIVYAKRAVVVTDAFHRWAMSHSTVDMAMQHFADIPPAGEVIANGRPVLTVFADGPNITCYEYLRARMAEVEARLYDSK
jgi:predicted ATP-grasp superfamily ATP-dependent carboligase